VLRQARDEAYLYRRLARLNLDADAPGAVDDLAWEGVPRAPFEALCAELGFESIPARVHRWA
ncbi:MAG TPA: flap endonuclease, partial [Actinomycetota bacterium]|nr:flap endonuclease [Actinomycetota bacterium]